MVVEAIKDYIRDKYEVTEVFEKLAEHMTLEDALDIIEDYDMFSIFEEEIKGEQDQFEFNF